MLPFIDSPELVIGICSPIGTDNKKIKDLIKNEISKYNYDNLDFKITDLMKSFKIEGPSLKDSPFEERYDTYIDYANRLRATFADSSLLGMICCGAIRAHRRKTRGKPDAFVQRTAYLFDQFKRREEVDILRQVYGGLFILVSIYSDKDNRCRRLTERISESHSVSRPKDEYETLAKTLMRRDEDEGGIPTGQRLREVFPLADIFVDVDNELDSEKSIKRFFQAFFASNAISPTCNEYGMYLAKSASFRSLDLSRQVGVAIIVGRDNIVALGCNEVPRANGGQYWSGDNPDARDLPLGIDENDRLKRSILADLIRRLIEDQLISHEGDQEQFVEIVLKAAVTKENRLRDAEVMDLIEFGRIVHAEMSALCEASRFGKAVDGATLYCTTFPCHICAKHIVAAGLRKVVYIEPYPKSYAEQLHSDSIVVQTGKYDGDKVQFECFTGIAPLRYRDLFSRGKRKDPLGKVLPWTEAGAKPIVELTVATYLYNETAIMKRLRTRINHLNGQIIVDKEDESFE